MLYMKPTVQFVNIFTMQAYCRFIFVEPHNPRTNNFKKNVRTLIYVDIEKNLFKMSVFILNRIGIDSQKNSEMHMRSGRKRTSWCWCARRRYYKNIMLVLFETAAGYAVFKVSLQVF